MRIITTACAVIFCVVMQAARCVNDNMLTLIDRPFICRHDVLKCCPCDISFIFFDFKYDGMSIKICEAGPAPCAGMPMSSVIVNGAEERMHSPYWELFWHFIARYKLPFWYIGKNPRMQRDAFAALGGRVVRSWRALEHDERFQSIVRPQQGPVESIEKMDAIIVSAHSPVSPASKNFKKKYPSCIIVNQHLHEIVSNKDQCNDLFKQPQLRKFKPACGIYEKKYSSLLAERILKDVVSDYVVIKPLCAHQSSGVIMANKKNIDPVLKSILVDKSLLRYAPHRSMRYWFNDTKDYFIAESYVPSTIIWVDGKPYDPTMRLVAFLSHEYDCMTLHIVAGFAKIPLKSLRDHCTLTEKHITIPLSGAKYVGIAIDQKIMNEIRNPFTKMLREFYLAGLSKFCTG